MSRTLRAGSVAATAFVTGIAIWSLDLRPDSLHLHRSHGKAFAHDHAYVGQHQHDDLPDAPDREDGDGRDDRRGTVSSLDSGAPLLPEATSIGPFRGARSGRLPAVSLPSPKVEPSPSAGPRAPPL